MNTSAKHFSPWPHAIIMWFVVAVSAMTAWIIFAVRQNMDLVRADYYEDEIRFQEQLDRLNRTTAVRGEIDVQYDAAKGEVMLRLPASHLTRRPSGRIRFYRPSDAALDVEVPLAVEATGVQRIGVGALRAGQWKIRVQWKAAGQDFFFEQTLVLDESEAALPSPVNRVP